MARRMAGQIHRSSLMPRRFPAWLNGWQGNPAVSMSHWGNCKPSRFLLRCAIAQANDSTSGQIAIGSSASASTSSRQRAMV